jgi:hypothetical protein
MSERDYSGGVDDVPDLWSPFNSATNARQRHQPSGKPSSLLGYQKKFRPRY